MEYHKMKYEANATTGEVIQREMTAEEIEAEAAEQKAANDAAEAQAQAHAEAEAIKAAAKTALLEKLGITESEAALLLS
jgi:hypothetical protein